MQTNLRKVLIFHCLSCGKACLSASIIQLMFLLSADYPAKSLQNFVFYLTDIIMKKRIVLDNKSRNIPEVVLVRRWAVGILGIWRGGVGWVKGGANGVSLQAT
jgi:hypothetical protein